MFASSFKPVIFIKKRVLSFHEVSAPFQFKKSQTVFLLCRCSFPATNFSSTSCSYQNHYEVLGITRKASNKDIKDAYLKLSKELHPDKHHSNGQSSESSDRAVHDRFLAVQMAYEVLGKNETKKIYDLGLTRDPSGTYGFTQGQTPHPNPNYRDYQEFPEFYDRARAMGYTIDPEYFHKHQRSPKKMVFFCLGLILTGFIIRVTVALHRQEQWEQQSRDMSASLKAEKKFESRSEHEAWQHFYTQPRNQGYQIDQDYYKKRSQSGSIAIGCLAFIVVGFAVQFTIGTLVSKHHEKTELNRSMTISKNLKATNDQISKFGMEEYRNSLHQLNLEHQERRRRLRERVHGVPIKDDVETTSENKTANSADSER